MALEDFNPYHQWLGIHPSEQPPNHYRLLGIELFESDLDLIDSAAEQRMAHLRTCQSGPYARLAQELFQEVTGARNCLMKPDTKFAYDESLGIPDSARPDFSGAPPIQFRNDRPLPRPASFPWTPILLLLILCGGFGYAIWHFANQNAQQDRVAEKANGGQSQNTSGQTSQNSPLDSSDASDKTSADENSSDSNQKTPPNSPGSTTNPTTGNPQADSENSGRSKKLTPSTTGTGAPPSNGDPATPAPSENAREETQSSTPNNNPADEDPR